jgi:hypothetical protein
MPRQFCNDPFSVRSRPYRGVMNSSDAGRTPARFRAQLFGGRGNGLMIMLPQLSPTITVYRNGGEPFVPCGDEHPSASAGALLIGSYDLVEPVGPDTPVYIPSR